MSTKTDSPPEVTPFTGITIAAAQVIPSPDAIFHQDTLAQEAITQGQAVLRDAATGLWRLADASVQYKVEGIAASGASPGQPVKVVKSDPALLLGSTILPGDVLYLGIVPGSITTTYADLVATKFVSVLGVAIAANKVNFNITRADAPK